MPNYNVYIEDVSVGAVFDKLGGVEGARRLLRNELFISEPTRSWREEDGVIYFSVTSNGTTGEDWIIRLESKGFRIGDSAKQVLHSPDFKPTKGLTEVAVLKGMLFEDDDRSIQNICAKANKWNLFKPNAELACLIREKFTDKEIEAMGLLYIVVMHEPINNSYGDPYLLDAGRDPFNNCLYTCGGRPLKRLSYNHGFAFAVSWVSSQS